MDNVTNIVNEVLDARGWRTKVLERMAVELWPEVVGEPINHHTMAERFANGTLYVRARSPQWTHELHFLENRILTRLNGRLKQPIVRKIRCNVTTPRGLAAKKIKPDWEDPSFPRIPPQTQRIRNHVDDEAARRADMITVDIQDEDMRRVMSRLIASVIRANAAREANGEDWEDEPEEELPETREPEREVHAVEEVDPDLEHYSEATGREPRVEEW